MVKSHKVEQNTTKITNNCDEKKKPLLKSHKEESNTLETVKNCVEKCKRRKCILECYKEERYKT